MVMFVTMTLSSLLLAQVNLSVAAIRNRAHHTKTNVKDALKNVNALIIVNNDAINFIVS